MVRGDTNQGEGVAQFFCTLYLYDIVIEREKVRGDTNHGGEVAVNPGFNTNINQATKNVYENAQPGPYLEIIAF